MCIICNIENIKELEGYNELDCSGCSNLTVIPKIKGLKILDCSGYPNLTVIPNIKGLKNLYCLGCPNLTVIPNIKGLKELRCSKCDKLFVIPRIIGLKNIDCSDCYNLTIIPKIDECNLWILGSMNIVNIPNIYLGKLSVLCNRCNSLILLNVKYCTGCFYMLSSKSTSKLQKYIHKRKLYYRIRYYLKQRIFTEWYYHPEYSGGKREKMSLGNFVSKIK